MVNGATWNEDSYSPTLLMILVIVTTRKRNELLEFDETTWFLMNEGCFLLTPSLHKQSNGQYYQKNDQLVVQVPI